jgi:hypothetical protein
VKKHFLAATGNLLSCGIATLVFEIFTALEILALLTVTRGSETAFDFLTRENFISCSKSTMILFSFIYFVSSPILLFLCGFVTKRLRVRYALSYALMVLLLSMIFFVPLVIAKSALIGVILVVALAVLPGFMGGYARGWLIDHWTGGSRHGTLLA